MSKINYNALAIDGLKEVFIQISKTCKELKIDFFIIGAIARNIWYVSNNENSKVLRILILVFTFLMSKITMNSEQN